MVAPSSPTAARSPRGGWTWAAAGVVLTPFLALACRVLAYPRHLFNTSDLAIMDFQVRKALHGHLQLGAYDRFGWHHPGPAYIYLVSFVARAVGPAHGLQAELAAAALVNGLCLAGAVLVAGRVGGVRAALGTATAVAVAVALMGPIAVWHPWNPYAVIDPLVLLGVLAAAAVVAGSGTALAAGLLVGTLVVQTDIGPAPYVAVLLAGAGVGWLMRILRRRDRRLSAAPILAAAALVAGALLCWVPPLVQQASGPDGNMSAIVRFFLHEPGHAGWDVGVWAAGGGLATGLGFPPPAFVWNPGPERAWLAACAVAGLALVALARWRRDRLATGLAVVFAAGIAVAVVAASRIYGVPWSYLMQWCAAATVVGLASFAVLAAGFVTGRTAPAAADGDASPPPRPRRRVLAAVAGAVVVVAAGGLVARVAVLPRIGEASDPQVAGAWRLVSPDITAAPRQRVGLVYTGFASLIATAGLADELAVRGVPFSVPADDTARFGPGRHLPAAIWVVLSDAPGQVPAGVRVLGTAHGLTVGVTRTQPPGWNVTGGRPAGAVRP